MRVSLLRHDRGRPVWPRWRAAVVLGVGLALVPGAGAMAQPPGPEVFAKPPVTPLELWDAADYLVRTGQSAQAVPYLKKFLAAGPDDATLLRVRDRYGVGSVLRLQDDPATSDLAAPLVDRLNAAGRRQATNPERIEQAIGMLSRSREEQDLGVEHLRQAGAYGVPPLLQAIHQAEKTPERHALLVRNLGRLDKSAVPPLIAALEAPAAPLAAIAADALGQLGDARAVPALVAASAVGKAPDAAVRAAERLTGRPMAAQAKTPAALLSDEARRYRTGQIRFPGDPVVVWAWDEGASAPAPRTVSKDEAAAYFGQKFARAALTIEPADRSAQAVLVGMALEQGTAATAAAMAAGPAVLTDVLRTAIADGKAELAATAASALGRVTDVSALAVEGPYHPLVEALSAPSRRVRFAAARALVDLDPRRPFAGSSRVAPVLAQFLGSRALPRAVVIDGNLARGNSLAGYLKELGYDPVVAFRGDEGFRAVAASADVELVLVDVHQIQGPWSMHDVLANLRADARTAGLPIYLYGPLNLGPDLVSIKERFPGVKFLVTPTNSRSLDEQLGVAGRPQALSAAERAAFARDATALLARIAGQAGSPFNRELAAIEPALTAAMNAPETAPSASVALGDVPLPAAQRGLADLLLDPSKPAPLRSSVAAQLARSVQKFGPLVAADQEARLLQAFDGEPDPALKTALGAVIGNLRPKAASTGQRLRDLPLAPAAGPAPAPAPSR